MGRCPFGWYFPGFDRLQNRSSLVYDFVSKTNDFGELLYVKLFSLLVGPSLLKGQTALTRQAKLGAPHALARAHPQAQTLNCSAGQRLKKKILQEWLCVNV